MSGSVFFVNFGMIDLDVVRVMGVNIKVGDDPIGHFGTGLKFAISVLLRTGHKIILCRELALGGKGGRLMPKTVHICEICDAKYDEFDAALACEQQTPKDWRPEHRPEIGDLVTCGHSYAWWSGDDDWCHKAEAKRGKPMVKHVWLVVGRFIGDAHEVRYVLWTKSDCIGKPQLATTSCFHMPVSKIGVASEELRMEGHAAYAPFIDSPLPIV